MKVKESRGRGNSPAARKSGEEKEQKKPHRKGLPKPVTEKSAGRKGEKTRYTGMRTTIKQGRPGSHRSSTASRKEEEPVRLNRYLANAGLCSRREADNYISAGMVTVNRKRITELGTKVSLKDEIRFNGELIRLERKVYILLNKPKDYVTTVSDPHAEKTVMHLVRNACRERVYPVGRLDRNTTGVLLLTNDGELASMLTHPKHKRKKIYHVTLDKNLKKPDMDTIVSGITLDDGFVRADAVSYVTADDKKTIGVELHSGQNRVVRRIFESLGYKVTKLDRVFFAGLTKKNLPRGKWRFLTEKEIGFIKMGTL